MEVSCTVLHDKNGEGMSNAIYWNDHKKLHEQKTQLAY